VSGHHRTRLVAADGARDGGESAIVQSSRPRPRWWKAIEERDRRALEENRKQIAEAEESTRAHEEREASEARKAEEAARAAYCAKHSGPM
jgi:hypothetical protein